ncbi:MAG: PQQ-binding-like beta-propeller repeat protein [Acidobacteria bacterium]|nr:PQQ-binding-like beta-propeller repeat protein [Acidobacteriota bacterium]
MIRGQSPARHSVVLAIAAITLSVALVAGVEAQREWRDYAGGPDSSRFVAAKQITAENVSRLQVAWSYPSGQTDFNPLVVRNMVYGRGPTGSIVALDATTGKQIWVHEGIQGFTTRGVNYWESKDGKDRRLIFSTLNMLQELDAYTGEPITRFGKDGQVDLRVGLDRDPPLVWTFHTVPRPGEYGYDTWPPDAWKTVGGANNWGEQSIDEKRGILFVPTASPKYNFYGGNRHGANLFADSIVALDVRTGKRLWHFQMVHHDIWDLDNNSAPQLTTIKQNGRDIDVVAVASKTGYLYVFDRVTGKPIWPIEERPVPQNSMVPGEELSPTQPFPTAPPPFSRQKFTADDLNPYILTPEEREQFRQRILKARNDGNFTPIGFDDVIHMPGNQGGSNWGSTAANPSDGTVYVIGFNTPTIIRLLKAGEIRRSGRGAGEPIKEGRYVTEGFGLYPTIVSPPYTTLTAYDLNKGTIKWQVGLGDDLRLVGQGIKGTGTAANVKGGLIVTATGLVFATAGDHKLHVYDSATGKQIAEFQLGAATSGGPSMYEVDGRQYLVLTASTASGGRGGRGAVETPAPTEGPVGIVAYALPK